jgi:hypothetical protein
MQRLQFPNQGNEDNLNNVRRKANRHFWSKKKKYKYMKAKIFEPETI